MHSLFADTFGPTQTLLTDGEATKRNIDRELEALTGCDSDDTVIIFYSGHGTPAHQILPSDADPEKLNDTTIGVDQLTSCISRIPSKRIICILDCCFAGGLGAKVFAENTQPIVKPKDHPQNEMDDEIQKIAGDGRLVITACTAYQIAIEDQRIQHGLLSAALIEAFMGVSEVLESGRIPLFKLLHYVVDRVQGQARLTHNDQRPAFRGQIDGKFHFPILKPGTQFARNFPKRVDQKIGDDISDLEKFGIPSLMIAALKKKIAALNALQKEAVNEYGVLNGANVLVCAPTSSGKTLIGEMAALKRVATRQRTIFLLPLKALVNDKNQYFQKTYGDIGLTVIQATGDTSDDVPDLIRGRYDICLMTYEKFTSLVLGFPHILNNIATIVVDEVQMLADSGRGANLEFLLTLINEKRVDGIAPQIIALSAVVGDPKGLDTWLGARMLRKTERPVPLDEGVIDLAGRFRYKPSDADKHAEDSRHVATIYRKGSGQDVIIPLVQKLVSEGKQVIVFRSQKGEARGCAGYLARELSLPAATEAISALPKGDPSMVSTELRTVLQAGVAFHVSDLEREERTVVETFFRTPNSKIRVIAATTTLAMGVNTPAEAVIVAGLTHPPDDQPYSVAEYKNIVGRAGRLGFAQRGISYIVAEEEYTALEYWNRYITGNPEDLESQFFQSDTDLRSIIIRILAMALTTTKKKQGMTRSDLSKFLSASFGAYQRKAENPNWELSPASIATAISDLVTHNLVSETNGELKLNELGWYAGQAGIEVESIIRLSHSLKTLRPEEISDTTMIALAQLTVELDQVLMPINRKSTNKEPNEWTAKLLQNGVPRNIVNDFRRNAHDSHTATIRAKKAVACLYWIADVELFEIERALTQFGGGFGGVAGAIRSACSRTYDVLSAVAKIAEILHPGLILEDRLKKLLVRLDTGVPANLIELAKIFGSRLSRANYRLLKDRNIMTLAALENATDDEILFCIDGDAAKFELIRRLQASTEHYVDTVGLVPLPLYEA